MRPSHHKLPMVAPSYEIVGTFVERLPTMVDAIEVLLDHANEIMVSGVATAPVHQLTRDALIINFLFLFKLLASEMIATNASVRTCHRLFADDNRKLQAVKLWDLLTNPTGLFVHNEQVYYLPPYSTFLMKSIGMKELLLQSMEALSRQLDTEE